MGIEKLKEKICNFIADDNVDGILEFYLNSKYKLVINKYFEEKERNKKLFSFWRSSIPELKTKTDKQLGEIFSKSLTSGQINKLLKKEGVNVDSDKILKEWEH